MIRVGLIPLGCDKNTVDSEYLAGLVEDAGGAIVSLGGPDDLPELDAVVVATCGFIGDAKRQSVETLVALAAQKTATGNPRRLFVAGCLSQRYADDLLKEIPEIDGVAGVGRFEQLAEMILNEPGLEKRRLVSRVPVVEVCRYMRRRRLTNKPYAFVKIADGCNHACAFCSIPLMKGRLRSVAPDILLREARQMLRQGVRELNLVAQDISVYGADQNGDCRLPDLLGALCGLDGDFWVRCLYCYPGGVTDALIETMAAQPKIVPYLDVPLQHLDNEMLGRMKRPCPKLDAARLVARLREAIPGLTLRTTMLVGFPGETPRAHRRMLEGMRALRFDRLGAFQFSREEGTVAARLARQVGKAVRERRWQAVMELQAEISEDLNRARIGQRARVLIEGYDDARRQWVGRSPGEAPEVDGVVFVDSDPGLVPGQFVEVEITDAEVYDVIGRRAASSGSRLLPG